MTEDCERSMRDRARTRLQKMTNRQLEKVASRFDVDLVRGGKVVGHKDKYKILAETEDVWREYGKE